MDQIEQFNLQLTNIINNANLPPSIISMCLNNVLYQIEITKLQNNLNEKIAIIDKMNELENKINTE